jgi:DNA gyrase/topoisomerase IV subunit B
MSIEHKEGINKIVKSALAPHWKSAEITKEQYADINRDVSRKLYEIVADQSIDDEHQKSTWEKLASAEVATAVKSLMA